MNTSITSNDHAGAGIASSVGGTDATQAGVPSTQGADAFSMINDLEMKLATLFRQLRDTLRQYNEAQQSSNYQLALTSYNTKMDSIQKDYESGMKACDGELAAGLTGSFFSALSLFKVGGEISQAWGQFGGGMGEAVKSGFDRQSKELSRESQELGNKADFQQRLAEGASQRSEQTLEMARQASEDLRQLQESITQMHDKLASALHR